MFKDYSQLQNILKNAQGLQEKMIKIQEELAEKTTEGSAGGGMVVATVNGKQELISVTIDPEVLASNDKQMLQDLIVAAVNQGIKSSRELMQQELSKMTGKLGLPPFGNGPLSGSNIPGLF